MKIIHFSDTHLGFSDLDIVNDEGVNLREADFYDAFKEVVESIKKAKPNYIIHTGDLFHRVSPSNRAIAFAMEQFAIIDSLNIPFIIIAGNHSIPRTSTATPIFKVFESFKNIYLSYDGYKKIEFDDIVFHTLPHMNDENRATNEIDKIIPNKDKKNVLMMHCSVGRDYLMKEFGEWVFPKEKEAIFEELDYVALGHWHGFGKVGKNIYYSGSTERTSISDKRQKGFIELNDFNVEFKEINVRKIIQKTIDIDNFEVDTSDTENAVVEVKLINLTPLKSIEISNNEIKEYFTKAVSVIVKREFIEEHKEYNKMESLSIEEAFLEHLKDDEDYERIENKVKELFAKYENMEEKI